MKSTFNLSACTFLWSVAVASLAGAAESDGQPPSEGGNATQAESTGDAASGQPQREIAFEVSDEELELQLFRADPGLLKQQFAADVSIYAPTRINWRVANSLGHSLGRFAPYQYFAHGLKFGEVPEQWQSTSFLAFASDLEETGREAEDTSDPFLSNAVERSCFTYMGASGATGGSFYRFRMLAPTEELARERSEAFVRMLDRSVKLPLNKHVRVELQAREKAVETLEGKLEEAQEAIAAINEQYKKTRDSGIDADELSRLKTERRLLDVDLAGIRARIDAAEEILGNLDRNAIGDRSRVEKLEDIKVTAEIDLAGLAARRGVLDQFIESGILRRSLADNFNEKQQAEQQIRIDLSGDQSRLKAFLEAEQAFTNLFALKDDKIVIHPIKWTGTE